MSDLIPINTHITPQEISWQSLIPLEGVNFIIGKLTGGLEGEPQVLGEDLEQTVLSIAQCEIPGIDPYYWVDPDGDVHKFKRAMAIIVPEATDKVGKLLSDLCLT